MRLAPYTSAEGDPENDREIESVGDEETMQANTVRSVVEDMESDDAVPFAWEDLDVQALHKSIQGDYSVPSLYASAMKQRCMSGEARGFLFFSRPGRGQGWHSHLEAFNVLV